ncbi:MAG: NHLP bacteriocin system secretion protein [Prochloraceae cyanobacterium]|nr:NHLP bacteriocin system secretion protein [Prochloraceae cyanobacterium]
MATENKMFRKEALERLSSPEQLDQLLKVVNPRAWIPLATAGSLLFVAVVWSVFGRLPLKVNGEGVLIYPHRVVPFEAPSGGQILTINIQPGDRVNKGDVIATLEQSQLEKQLQQQRDKLAELEGQKQDTNRLEQRKIALERETLKKERANLEDRLRRDSIVPSLRRESLVALEKNRESIEQRLEQTRNLLPTLEKMRDARRRLFEQGAISEDVALEANQRYFSSLAQISQLEVQLQTMRVEKINSERQILDLENEIDQINTKLQEIQSKEARLAQQALESSIQKNNNIQEVKRQIARLETELREKSKIVSRYNGLVLEISKVPGDVIPSGTSVGSIEVEQKGDRSKLVALAYFADKDGKRIKEGMSAQVTPSIVKRERYGGIVGEVTKVSSFPVTVDNVSTIIGNQKLAENLVNSSGKAAMQVFVQLEADPNTFNGYKWSSSDGPPVQLSSGITTRVRVKVGEVAPISYVIPLFRSLTGVY